MAGEAGGRGRARGAGCDAVGEKGKGGVGRRSGGTSASVMQNALACLDHILNTD
jgi:hypothetical protein